MNKKAGTGKSGGQLLGKSSGGGSQGKSSFGTGSKASKPLIPGGGGGKSSASSETHKTYLPSSGLNPKSGKSSTFGIIWIPTRRNKQKKDLVYNPHKDDHSKDRAPTMYNFMSGDSDKQTYTKKEDGPESVSALTDRLRAPAASAAGVGLVATAESLDATAQETSELIKRGETKEAAGDATENISNDDDKDYLENDAEDSKSPMTKSETNPADKVDSVYLRAPPPHKRAAPPAAPEDESCGFKCLYYTLQCCDCVLM